KSSAEKSIFELQITCGILVVTINLNHSVLAYVLLLMVFRDMFCGWKPIKPTTILSWILHREGTYYNRSPIKSKGVLGYRKLLFERHTHVSKKKNLIKFVNSGTVIALNLFATRSAQVATRNVACEATVFEICTMIMDEDDLQRPDCGDSVAILYQTLRREILSELSHT
ncbi:hypothetical protein MAR_027468, partial [Mya arenaria]